MPLVRTQVRNEYGLGMPELYKDADKEDPKALLDGVAVAGLVGILRQLGDLAEFAAEVFHGLQEQVMNTSSRSNKLMVRAQNIEAAYSPLEKTLLAQRSHLHFAYTNGSHWQAHVQSEQNHFIHSDLPLFIMDSYEECRGPPRLHLLDKFDTGGPGSCLKRYSDPTFFKRASAGFEEAYAENFPRDKKARRRKKMNQKKRTWIQNGDKPQRASPGLPTASHSDRMHYASQNFDEQTTPSHAVSTFDAASKLEMEDHSNSFGSRTASGYGESVLSPSYNIKFDGCEPEEISSQLTVNISDILDTSSLEEQRRVVDNYVEEQTGPRSSSVTWDEKTELMDPTVPQYHDEETTEVHPDLSPDPLEGEAANTNFDYCSNGSTPKTGCGANQLDDNESETDNYVDALNTIESESETDLECQTKGKLKQSLNNIAMDRSIDRLNLQYMNITSSNNDSSVHNTTDVAISEENHNPNAIQTSCNISEEASISQPSSVNPECYHKVLSPLETGKSSHMESLPFSDDITSPNTKTVEKSLHSLDPTQRIEQPSQPDFGLSSPSKSQKSPSIASGVTGTNFWTNGVLLGLQPSKPSDFSALDSEDHESLVPSSRSDILEVEENASKPIMLRNSKLSKQDGGSRCATSSQHDEEDIISIMKTSLRSSQAHSDRIPELTTNVHHSFSSNQSHNLLFPETSTMVLGTEKQDNLDARTFIEQFGSESPFISPSSSPPLEHMKISFQPINGLETSKLKLKFPNGNEGPECGVDVFSSFQLVPEESISLQDVGSDSDGDTFCESSPHGSADCLSHYSESDSEEWDARESPRCNDNDIYDALWGNSAESVSSNLDVRRITQGVTTNKSGIQNLFTDTVTEHSQTDLPNFDILNGSFRKDSHSDSETKYQLDSDFSNEPTPPPPPLPPMEWRGMKPNPDVGIEQQFSSVQALEHDFYKKLPTSTISQQPKPAPVNHDNTEDACTTNNKHPNGKKLDVKKDANQPLKSKVADEKEDFLQQIRTKSFSLRRTATERPNVASSAPANVSVTAILEKANAIRQAVGSDEGEDDDSCWSED